MAAPKKKEFIVTVKVVVLTDLSIRAESMEQALEQAKELGVKDVVEFDTAFCDGSIEISSVSDPKTWL